MALNTANVQLLSGIVPDSLYDRDKTTTALHEIHIARFWQTVHHHQIFLSLREHRQDRYVSLEEVLVDAMHMRMSMEESTLADETHHIQRTARLHNAHHGMAGCSCIVLLLLGKKDRSSGCAISHAARAARAARAATLDVDGTAVREEIAGQRCLHSERLDLLTLLDGNKPLRNQAQPYVMDPIPHTGLFALTCLDVSGA